MVVCWGGGRQAAGVGGVRGLAGRGGVVCQSEHSFHQRHVTVMTAIVFLTHLYTGVTYLSWQGGRGTKESLQKESRGRAPGAPWERRAWSWAAGSCHRPD